MFRQFLKVALALTLVGQTLAANVLSADAAPLLDAGVEPRLISASQDELVFEVTVPTPETREVIMEGQTFQVLSLPGYVLSDAPGLPQLPQTGVMVGIPATGDISLRVISAESEILPGSYRIAPAVDHVARYDANTGAIDLDAGLSARFVLNADAYARDGFFPEEVAQVAETAFIRNQRVARLALHPVQYNPVSGEVRLVRSLKIAVSFPRTDSAAQLPAAASDVLDPMLSASLLNYQQALAWRVSADPAHAPEAAPAVFPGDTSRPWFKTWLRFSGLYRVTLADLQGDSLAPLASAPPARLQVWKDGQQVPAHFIGDGDAVFEDGEALVFYALIAPSVYSNSDVYWLTAGDSNGLRMSAVDATPGGGAADGWAPAVQRFEEDQEFVHDLPFGSTPTYPRWYWRKLSSLFTPSVNILAALPRVVNSGYTATLTVRMMGVTDVAATPDHHVRVRLNGQAVGDMIWNGKSGHEQQFAAPASLLRTGQNTLTLEIISDLGAGVDESYLDWFQLDFRQQPAASSDRLTFSVGGAGRRELVVRNLSGPDALAYDISNPSAPVRLTGVQVTQSTTPESGDEGGPEAVQAVTFRTYLPLTGGESPSLGGSYQARFGRNIASTASFAVARPGAINRVQPLTRDVGSNLRANTNRADYLLVYHADFNAAAQALANHRRAGGLAVAAVDVQDIFDEFSNGRSDPNAIQSFVRHAYQSWQSPAPAYLLLLGDGHYDYRMNTGQANFPNFIPPFYACVDPWLCEVATDNAFVTVSGNDAFPDLAVGRLPVNTPPAASQMVNKIIGYETAPPAGNWSARLVFVSDNSRDANGVPDDAGDFEAMNEAVITHIPPTYGIRRVYYDPYAADDGGEAFRQRTAAAATTAIVGEVNAGALFLNYIGHASTTTWAHEAVLRARDPGMGDDRNDVTQMNNGGKLPIALDMACLSGNFADPRYTGIESMMLGRNGGGTVAGWGATGFGVATGHDRLHRGFYDGIFQSDLDRLGLATIAGKQVLFATGQSTDLMYTFGLLGDPALKIGLPSR